MTSIMAAFLTALVAMLPAPAAAAEKPKCRDSLAVTLANAGFHGKALRQAWAIAMRESHGRNLDESSPWYSGALGIFQIQTSAWSGQSWWSRSAMLNADKQARIVYRYFYKRTGWRHWGLTKAGTLDTTYYGGWSSWQHEAWIMQPYRKFYAQFPKKCAAL